MSLNKNSILDINRTLANNRYKIDCQELLKWFFAMPVLLVADNGAAIYKLFIRNI